MEGGVGRGGMQWEELDREGKKGYIEEKNEEGERSSTELPVGVVEVE